MSKISVDGSSEFGSVKYVDGEMLSDTWQSVYIPLDEKDAREFIRKVNDAERKNRRRLRAGELIHLALDR